MANLASVILEGANQTSTPSVDTSNYDFSETILAESSFIDSAVATLFTNIMEAEQEYMVADVVGAATIIHENSLGNNVDAIAVTEGVVKNGIAKLKAAFTKFLAKIKEYYHKVITWFKAMFSNAEDFAKNYGDTLKQKAAKTKGFIYDGYKYDVEGGKTRVNEIKTLINKKMTNLVGEYDFVNEAKSKKELKAHLIDSKIISKDFDKDEATSSSDEIDKFLSEEIKVSDIAEMKKDLVELYHDGAEKKSPIKDFEANSLDSMITYLKNSKKTIEDFEKDLKNYEDKTNTVISKLGKFEAVKDEDGGANLVSNASYLSSLMTAFLNLYKVPCEVQIAIHKAMASEYLAALKKFYNFKGVKESVEIFDEEAYATLENAIILESDDESDDKGKKSDDTEECTESAVASILEQAARFTF